MLTPCSSFPQQTHPSPAVGCLYSFQESAAPLQSSLAHFFIFQAPLFSCHAESTGIPVNNLLNLLENYSRLTTSFAFWAKKSKVRALQTNFLQKSLVIPAGCLLMQYHLFQNLISPSQQQQIALSVSKSILQCQGLHPPAPSEEAHVFSPTF